MCGIVWINNREMECLFLEVAHGQMGYGLGGLFCSVARAVMPMVKSEAKTLGKIALNWGKDVKKKAVKKLQTLSKAENMLSKRSKREKLHILLSEANKSGNEIQLV